MACPLKIEAPLFSLVAALSSVLGSLQSLEVPGQQASHPQGLSAFSAEEEFNAVVSYQHFKFCLLQSKASDIMSSHHYSRGNIL